MVEAEVLEAEGGAVPTVSSLHPHRIPPKRGVCGVLAGEGGGRRRREAEGGRGWKMNNQ